MKVQFLESFERDLRRSGDPHLAKQVRKLLVRLENTDSLSKIAGVKKLAGHGEFYRIRLGDYRVGVVLTRTAVTLVRVLHRKEIYRYFP